MRRAGWLIALWAPVVVVVATLWWFSSQPAPPGAEWIWDKAAHVVAYMVFGLAVLRATHGGLNALQRRPLLWGVLLTLAYGAIDELHQSLVPGRHASLLDWLADALGVAVALPLFQLMSIARRRCRGVHPVIVPRAAEEIES